MVISQVNFPNVTSQNFDSKYHIPKMPTPKIPTFIKVLELAFR